MKTRIYLFPRTLLVLFALGSVAPASNSAPPARVAINFPFRSPETAPTSTFLTWLAELGAPAIRQFTYHDTLWEHVEPANDAFDYSGPDAVIFNPHGIRTLPTLYAILAGARDVYGLQVPWRACTNPPPYAPDCGWFAPRDAADSRNYVTNTVARYRSAAQFWEIANEMNGKTSRPLGLPVSDFAQFLNLNRAWIQSVAPEAKVVLPGVLGTYGFPFGNSTNWLRQLLLAGGGTGFDVANFHDYNSWWTLPRHFDMLRATLDAHGLTNTPIWITETGISSRTNTPITPRYSTPDSQAADVWRRLALLYGKGAQLVAWHNFYSTAHPPGADAFDQFGLLDELGRKKKSWHAMKLLIGKLEGFRDAQLLALGRVTDDNLDGGEGRWVVQFTCADGVRRWVLWSPTGESWTLTGLSSNHTYQVTHVVPASISPDGHTATFTTSTFKPATGAHTLALGDFPILVEPPKAPDGLSLRIAPHPVAGVEMRWSADLDEATRLETSPTLASPVWTNVPPEHLALSLAGGEVRASYLGPLVARQFFRLRWDAP